MRSEPDKKLVNHTERYVFKVKADDVTFKQRKLRGKVQVKVNVAEMTNKQNAFTAKLFHSFFK